MLKKTVLKCVPSELDTTLSNYLTITFIQYCSVKCPSLPTFPLVQLLKLIQVLITFYEIIILIWRIAQVYQQAAYEMQ